MTKRAPNERVLDLVAEGLTNPQLADALGVTERTLCRWRASDPSLNQEILAERARQAAEKPPPEHGTRTRYNYGCRCQRCRDAHSAAHYQWSLRVQQFATRYGRRSDPSPTISGTSTRAEARRSTSRRERIEQALARGCPTSTIMADLGVTYQAVQDVRQAIAEAVSA